LLIGRLCFGSLSKGEFIQPNISSCKTSDVETHQAVQYQPNCADDYGRCLSASKIRRSQFRLFRSLLVGIVVAWVFARKMLECTITSSEAIS